MYQHSPIQRKGVSRLLTIHKMKPLSFTTLLWGSWALGQLISVYTEASRTFPAQQQQKRPHILMIVMDDLGSHDLGLHGTGILTPNADELASTGIYLDKYYVLPSCSPTRASLFSGKYPLHTGVSHWIHLYSTAGLPLEEETLADLLQRDGIYETHAVGKWHIGHSKWEQTPTFRGFDSFFGFYGGGEDYFSHVNDGAYDLRHDKQPKCGQGCSQLVDARGTYSTHLFSHQATQVIQDYATRHGHKNNQPVEQQQQQEDEDSKPLFLYLAYQAVHCPNQVPQEYMDRYNHTDWSDQKRNYAGMLTAADEGIGNVTDALKHYGLWDDTLVIFTTDNGGPTQTCCVQGSSNYPKRGGKCTIWEGGTTGDGFLSGPALAKLGFPTATRFPHMFHVVDWLPTLAELVGVVPRHLDQLDGKSQLASLRNEGGSPARNELFVGYVKNDNTNSWYGPSVRFQNWKLIQGCSGGPHAQNMTPAGTRLPVPGGISNSTYLLFDLEQDPQEDNDLSDLYPEIVRSLRYKLQLYQQSYVPPQPNDDSSCPFTGLVNTTMGPAIMPWCHGASEIVVYE